MTERNAAQNGTRAGELAGGRARKRPESKAIPRPYSKHGLVTLKYAVRRLGGRAIDQRTRVGKRLAAWRADLVRDLGGEVSTQQAAVIDLAVRTRLLLDSVDTWLLSQPSLVNLRRRALLPVVRDRQQLGDALARYMQQLGLERRPKPVTDLKAFIASRAPK